MSFNPDSYKKARGDSFSYTSHPLFLFSNIKQRIFQKHLGRFLNERLKFDEHLKIVSVDLKKTENSSSNYRKTSFKISS